MLLAFGLAQAVTAIELQSELQAVSDIQVASQVAVSAVTRDGGDETEKEKTNNGRGFFKSNTKLCLISKFRERDWRYPDKQEER